jgi:HEPN domain-containing protein
MANLDVANEWLRRAKGNLLIGKDDSYLDLRDIPVEDLCFNLQQCTEKSLKALLIYNEVEFPFVHDIASLLTILKLNKIEVPQDLICAAKLTIYAVSTRYPGDYNEITEEDYREAVEIAENVYNWAKNQIK